MDPKEISEKKNIDHLAAGAKELLSATEQWIDEARNASWTPTASTISYYHVVLRAILIKQYESMQTILTLEGRSEGFSGVPLLRAICEEFIWATYLGSLDQEEASRIIEALGAVGIHETFLAQEGYKIPNSGFPEKWKTRSAKSYDLGRSELQRLFVKHGFKLKGQQTHPSLAQIAKSVSMEDLYKFLYHATSRAVHFSVPELLRRLWGRPGQIYISSQNFERYWAAFAIYWGARLYALTFLKILLILQSPDFPDENVDQVRHAVDQLDSHGAIPILTTQEVFWPEEWEM